MRLPFKALLAALAFPLTLGATVDDALSFAYEAATRHVQEGFTFREDAWGGDLGVGDQQAVTAQLFKGNAYWFCLGTDTKDATITVHVYDSKGKLVGKQSWQEGHLSGELVEPKQTGTYYAIVEVEKSPEERTHWALVYGYK